MPALPLIRCPYCTNQFFYAHITHDCKDCKEAVELHRNEQRSLVIAVIGTAILCALVASFIIHTGMF